MIHKEKLEYLSINVVGIMEELSKDKPLTKLLINNTSEPYDTELPYGDNNWENKDTIKRRIIIPSDEYCKISPTPFDPEAQEEDESFVRVYYNQGRFDQSEVVLEPQLFIDIIVSKDLWLINNKEISLIRPYEIMGRIVSRTGRDSLNGKIKLNFSGFQHLHVNTEFDAVRLFSDSFNIEA